jgi:hypothetical protein
MTTVNNLIKNQVSFWINTHFNARNKTTLHLEGLYAIIKSYIQVSIGDLLTLFNSLLRFWEQQH